MALNWPQPGDAVDLGRVDEVLDGLANWCEATALLPDQETRQRLQRQVTAVREKREQLLSPLLIAIIGGTGVGKSSLLNALAGGPIAAASARRPTTQQVTVYLHEDNLLALEPGEWAAAQVRHQRAELLDRILIDTPDYDSVDLSHRRRMQTVLALADVVIFVTTREKYADLAGAEWLRQYREGRLFLFVLNRADEGVPPEVVPDLRRHLAELGFAGAEPLVLSATAALAA
ncbi:MAG: 50S ribosome-binding GTPase, partial [Armatimonadetes bacterium]|nr:50S ribosome-binding GTPase [Armatimonadota bacterium]